MIQTLMAGQEYVDSAKRAGIYSELLAYVAKYQNYSTSNQVVISQPKTSHIQRVEKANSEQKAIGYFQACLEVFSFFKYV